MMNSTPWYIAPSSTSTPNSSTLSFKKEINNSYNSISGTLSQLCQPNAHHRFYDEKQKLQETLQTTRVFEEERQTLLNATNMLKKVLESPSSISDQSIEPGKNPQGEAETKQQAISSRINFIMDGLIMMGHNNLLREKQVKGIFQCFEAILQQKDSQIKQLETENQSLRKRIRNLEVGIDKSQENDRKSKTILQALKQAIHKNRQSEDKIKKQKNQQIEQLQRQINAARQLLHRLHQNNQELREKNQQLLEQNQELTAALTNIEEQQSKLKQKQQQLISEANCLKDQLNWQRSILSSQQLHSQIQENKRDKERLNAELRKRSIQLACIQKKHSNQLNDFSKLKGEQVLYHKKRYSELFSKYKTLKSQLQNQQRNYVSVRGSNLTQQRDGEKKTPFEIGSMEKKGSISFELSSDEISLDNLQ